MKATAKLLLMALITVCCVVVGALSGPAHPSRATVNGQGTPTLYGAADTAVCGLILVRGGNMVIGAQQPVTISLPDGTVLAATDPAGNTALTYLANLKDNPANKFGNFQVLLHVHPPAGATSVVLSARYAQDPASYIVPIDYVVPLGPACGS